MAGDTATVIAAVAAAISLGAIVVASEQWRVARAKFRLDLFDKRYVLYEQLWSFMSGHVRDEPALNKLRIELQNNIPKFYFLFGREIGRYVEEEVMQRSITFGFHQATLARAEIATPAAYEAAAKGSTEVYQWFYSEGTALRSRFAPFLAFEEWKADKVGD